MFRRLHDAPKRTLRVIVDGTPVDAAEDDTVAAVLLALGMVSTRVSPVSGAPRGPYCLMGVCFECLVTIDGVGNRQACMIPVADGMTIETQKRRREAGL